MMKENEQIIGTFATTFAALFAMIITKVRGLDILSFYGITQYAIVLGIISIQGYIAGCKADYTHRERFGNQSPDKRYIWILLRVIRWELFVLSCIWMSIYSNYTYIFVISVWSFSCGYLADKYRELLRK